MKKIGICGHFGFGHECLNGQTIKTKIVTKALVDKYGKEEIKTVDSFNAKKRILSILWGLLNLLRSCNNIIIFPAHKGLRVFAPFLAIFNNIFKRNLIYVVIGGWLPEFLQDKGYLKKALLNFDYIYVETSDMKQKLELLGLKNIMVMPNCKNIQILGCNELVFSEGIPLKVCTFSRVMKEKGIEDAIYAVDKINKKYGKAIYELDIYGQIDENYKKDFYEIVKNLPKNIRYVGLIPFDKSVEVIKKYYALLFPTYYEGEGFAGTILDAFSSGVPVIATNWRYNAEIIEDGKTGIIYETKDKEKLVEKLEYIYINKNEWESMKVNCLEVAKKYTPSKVIEKIVII